jgi:hypothetical protein
MMASLRVVSATADRVVLGFAGSSPRARFVGAARHVGSAAELKREKRRLATMKAKGVRKTLQLQPATVSNALKARWANNGDGRNPQRRFFALSAEDKVFLAKHALRELTRMAGRAILGRALGRR